MSKIMIIVAISQASLLLTLPKMNLTYIQGIAMLTALPKNQMESWELIQGLSPKNQHMIFRDCMQKTFD